MRRLLFFLVSLVVIGAVLYFTSGIILTILTNHALEYLSQNVKTPNLEYTKPSFQGVGFSSFNAITWRGISTNVTMMRRVAEKYSASIEECTICLEDIFRRAFLITIKGLSSAKETKFDDPLHPPRGTDEIIKGGDLSFRIAFNVLTLDDALAYARNLTDELRKFSQDGVTKLPLEFSAEQTFDFKGKTYTFKFRTQKEGDDYRLVMDEKELRRLGSFGGNLAATESDLKIIARYPLRAAQLVRLRDKAETVSALAKRKDPKVPEAAYRHVLWAYMLTKEYSEKFSQEVTTSHETAPDREDSPDKRKALKLIQEMAVNNNNVGRSYAIKGYRESEILDRVMHDSAVIRDDEIGKKKAPTPELLVQAPVRGSL